MTRRRIMHQSAGFALAVAAAALIGPAAGSAKSSNAPAQVLALGTPLAGPTASPTPDVDTGGDVASPPVSVFPAVSADTAIVIDRRSGAVLGSKHPDLLWAPASTTKMMTALLTIEAVNAGQVSLDDQVHMQADVRIEAWAGGIGLEPGDVVSLRDLLYMTLVKSGGDAATAMGTYVAGSRAAFVAMMNTRARELGLDNTHFVDISGRDPEDLNEIGENPAQANCHGNEFHQPACAHYSTARDLAALARVALDDPLFAQIVSTDHWRVGFWYDQSVHQWLHPIL